MASALEQVYQLVQDNVNAVRAAFVPPLPVVIWDFGNRVLKKPKTNERVCWVRDQDEFVINHKIDSQDEDNDEEFDSIFSGNNGVTCWIFGPSDEAAELLRNQVILALHDVCSADLHLIGAKWELPEWLYYGETCQLYFSIGQPIGFVLNNTEVQSTELEPESTAGNGVLEFDEDN